MLTKTYALRCDGCGRASNPRGWPDTRQARRDARAQRWTRVARNGDRPAVDYCPRCADRNVAYG